MVAMSLAFETTSSRHVSPISFHSEAVDVYVLSGVSGVLPTRVRSAFASQRPHSFRASVATLMLQ